MWQCHLSIKWSLMTFSDSRMHRSALQVLLTKAISCCVCSSSPSASLLQGRTLGLSHSQTPITNLGIAMTNSPLFYLLCGTRGKIPPVNVEDTTGNVGPVCVGLLLRDRGLPLLVLVFVAASAVPLHATGLRAAVMRSWLLLFPVCLHILDGREPPHEGYKPQQQVVALPGLQRQHTA